MIIAEQISEIENKNLDKLSESELLILNYWNTYREANLYYELMVSCINQNLIDLALSYAAKGKIASTQALAFQNKLKLNETVNDFSQLIKDQEDDLNATLDGVTKTIHYLHSNGEFGNVLQMIPKVKTEKNLKAIMAKLASAGLEIKQSFTPEQKANVRLKILDNLFFNGQISEKMYNQKCKEIMLKKLKLA